MIDIKDIPGHEVLHYTKWFDLVSVVRANVLLAWAKKQPEDEWDCLVTALGSLGSNEQILFLPM